MDDFFGLANSQENQKVNARGNAILTNMHLQSDEPISDSAEKL
jgi:hypothetical protein